MSSNVADEEYTSINAGLSDLKDKVTRLKAAVHLFQQGKIPIEDLQLSLKNTRNSYKEIEFYIAYH